MPDSENLSQTAQAGDNNIGFAAASGAYFVETNGGGTSATAGPAFGADQTIGAYRANAAAAQYSRVIACQMYGSGRVYGYLYGGSGGGYRVDDGQVRLAATATARKGIQPLVRVVVK